MKLTVEQHREAIKRYGHVKPARGWRVQRCSTRCPGTHHACTREKGHRGPHVAHTYFARVVAVWDSGAVAQPQGTVAVVSPNKGSKAAPTHRAGGGSIARRPIGLRTRSPVGIVEALQKLLVRAISSWDEIAFIVLFVIFVRFAIHVLMRLY